MLSSGVLAHLERLETKSRKKFEESQGAESDLGSKIRKLRSLRDKLKAEVQRRQARVSRRVAVGRLPPGCKEQGLGIRTSVCCDLPVILLD